MGQDFRRIKSHEKVNGLHSIYWKHFLIMLLIVLVENSGNNAFVWQKKSMESQLLCWFESSFPWRRTSGYPVRFLQPDRMQRFVCYSQSCSLEEAPCLCLALSLSPVRFIALCPVFTVGRTLWLYTHSDKSTVFPHVARDILYFERVKSYWMLFQCLGSSFQDCSCVDGFSFINLPLI